MHIHPWVAQYTNIATFVKLHCIYDPWRHHKSSVSSTGKNHFDINRRKTEVDKKDRWFDYMLLWTVFKVQTLYKCNNISYAFIIIISARLCLRNCALFACDSVWKSWRRVYCLLGVLRALNNDFMIIKFKVAHQLNCCKLHGTSCSLMAICIIVYCIHIAIPH